ncbi:MAG: hypothetical protein HKN10_19215 [Myxococcales bacterium]|nr:hypothetical protein [Myxococcales bacterium]
MPLHLRSVADGFLPSLDLVEGSDLCGCEDGLGLLLGLPRGERTLGCFNLVTYLGARSSGESVLGGLHSLRANLSDCALEAAKSDDVLAVSGACFPRSRVVKTAS